MTGCNDTARWVVEIVSDDQITETPPATEWRINFHLADPDFWVLTTKHPDGQPDRMVFLQPGTTCHIWTASSPRQAVGHVTRPQATGGER